MHQRPNTVLQVNLNRCTVAHDLLEQTAATGGMDVCLVSEPNRAFATAKGWLLDERGDSAIWVVNKLVSIEEYGQGHGIVWIKLRGGQLILSCYFSPNRPIEEFRDFLDELSRLMVKTTRSVLVAGDFNAKSPEWGAISGDKKGEELSDWAASSGLVVANEGSTPTFQRTTGQGSIVDITLVSEDLRLTDWRVLEGVETLSDHRYITYNLGGNTGEDTTLPRQIHGWKRTNEDVLRQEIRLRLAGDRCATAERLMVAIREAHEVATTGGDSKNGKKRTPKYWWTQEIAEARRWCVKARRAYNRALSRRGSNEQDRGTKLEQLRGARRSLKWLVKKSKERAWQNLCDEVESQPWGLGYKLVTGKLKAMCPALHSRPSEELQNEAIGKLFPDAAEEEGLSMTIEDGRENEPPPPPVTLAEVTDATSRRGGKAPGPDGVPASVTMILGTEAADYIREVADTILTGGGFPVEWKRARVALIPKPGKPTGDPSSLRPICLLSTVGKLFERIITNRLVKELEDGNLLSPEQYGFRQGRSTLMAIERIISVAEDERQKSLKTRGAVLVILLDISNAFNSMPWNVIKDALREKGISPYLRRVIDNYLSERVITWGSEGREKQMTVGVPQGSVLGPVLWNVAYDGVLSLAGLPPETLAVAYADDLALVIRGKTAVDLEYKAETALAEVSQWLEQRQLRLAGHKTEAILLKGRKRMRKLAIRLDGEVVTYTKRSTKYLGVVLDEGMTFVEHVHTVTARAEKVTSDLAKILPRVGGAGENRRRLLATVADSVVLYASPIWGPTVLARGGERIRKKLQSVQRRAALRTTRAYRTVDAKAALVLARATPWEDTMLEHAERWKTKHAVPDENLLPIPEDFLEKLQRSWEPDGHGGGQWTRRLIPDLRAWYGRGHGQTTYHLTQVLSGHGCFQAYLHRFRKAASPLCLLCEDDVEDTAEHTMFHCARFNEERIRLATSLGTDAITPDNLVDYMLRNDEYWEKVTNSAERILKAKETLERKREGVIGD